MKVSHILILLFLTSLALADDFSVIKLNDVFFEGKHFARSTRDPLIDNNGLTDRYLQYELNLHFGADLLKFGYWNNMIHSQADNSDVHGGGQFRLIGWKFEIGLRLTDFLDVEFGHYSRHLLDAKFPYAFPLQDYVGFKLYLFKEGKDGRPALLPAIF